MLSVIIATDESERALVPTLAALVPGATAGAIREVIVADKGSRDQTAEVADVAGCRLLVVPAAVAGRLRAAAKVARASWLMFLRPGIAPDPSWIPETMRFIEAAELSGESQRQAAVFSPGPGRDHPAIAALRMALLRRPRPEQGLIIPKRLYDSVGGHHDGVDCETHLLRRVGRRRLVVLRTAAPMVD